MIDVASRVLRRRPQVMALGPWFWCYGLGNVAAGLTPHDAYLRWMRPRRG